MTTPNLLIAAGIIYGLGVYLAFFSFGVLGETPDDIDNLFILFWPIFLVNLALCGICEIAQNWTARLKHITGPIARFLRKPLFYLSLPFRPSTLGRLVRERLHLP